MTQPFKCELCPPERPVSALLGDILCELHRRGFDSAPPRPEILVSKVIDADFMRKSFTSSLGEARR